MNANNSNSSNSSSRSKKRKANDGRAATGCAHDVSAGNTNDGGGFFSSWFGYFSGRRGESSSETGLSPNECNNTRQLNRMEQMMMRMEEKLATVSRLESKCEQLEKKCSSLENMLESTSKATKEHIETKLFDLDRKCDSLGDRLEAKVDSLHKQEADKALKRHEYNAMLIKNQSREYPVPLPSEHDFIRHGYTVDEAEYLSDSAEELKDCTTLLRRGEFSYADIGEIYMKMNDEDPPFSYEVNKLLLSHWVEFAAALDNFTPAINLLPDDCESSFMFYYVQLNPEAMLLVKNALIGKPFKRLAFTNNHNGGGARGGMSVDAILEIVESNEHLRKLEIDRNQIGSQHIDRLCSAVRNRRLVQLDLYNSFEAGTGDELIASLLTIEDLTLEKLNMSSNNITSAVSNLLADFLATNPRLKKLELCGNNLNDSDAVLIANALRSNTTLRFLDLNDNNTTVAGEVAFLSVLCDESSLNAAADSNHICIVYGDTQLDLHSYNCLSDMEKNRARKVYALLSSRNKTMSNVQHFSDIDLKILPNMLAAVQKYSSDVQNYDPKVNPLSIVYEIMRKWDKVIPLYKSLGG